MDAMLSGRKMSPECYELIRRIGNMTRQAVTASDVVRRNFTALRTQMNRSCVEACRAQGIDLAHPLGATAEIGSSKGKIIVHWKKASTKKQK